MGSAPAPRRSFTTSACPFSDAQQSGVSPSLSTRLGSAPASRRRATRARSPAFAPSRRLFSLSPEDISAIFVFFLAGSETKKKGFFAVSAAALLKKPAPKKKKKIFFPKPFFFFFLRVMRKRLRSLIRYVFERKPLKRHEIEDLDRIFSKNISLSRKLRGSRRYLFHILFDRLEPRFR